MQSKVNFSVDFWKSRHFLSALLLASFLALAAAPLQAQVFAPIAPLSFSKIFGGADPLPQTITVASAGSAFNFSVTSVTTGSGGAWLSVSNVSWNHCGLCSTPESLTVTVAPAITLAAGVYVGQIVFTSGSVNMTLPVTLTVAPSGGAFLDSPPGALNFSFKTGDPTPPAQPLPIRNGGPGTLNWTLATSTADGGAWLNASLAGGTAPSVSNISVNKANLPGGGLTVGTFIGRVLLQSASGNVSVPISVTVGPAVFGQINGINFTKPFGGANPLSQV